MSSPPPPPVTITTHGQINIVPKPQARPRFGSIPGRGGRGAPRKVCMTDPTKAYKKTLLREWYRAIAPEQRAYLPLQGKVTLNAEFVFARPKSHYKAASKKRKLGATDTPQLTARAAQKSGRTMSPTPPKYSPSVCCLRSALNRTTMGPSRGIVCAMRCR